MFNTSNSLANFPMVQRLVMELRNDGMGLISVDRALRDIHELFVDMGPYEYARRFGLLVNGSGEEFAMQFMAAWNIHSFGEKF